MTEVLAPTQISLSSINGSGISASDIESQIKKLQVDPQCYWYFNIELQIISMLL